MHDSTCSYWESDIWVTVNPNQEVANRCRGASVSLCMVLCKPWFIPFNRNFASHLQACWPRSAILPGRQLNALCELFRVLVVNKNRKNASITLRHYSKSQIALFIASFIEPKEFISTKLHIFALWICSYTTIYFCFNFNFLYKLLEILAYLNSKSTCRSRLWILWINYT